MEDCGQGFYPVQGMCHPCHLTCQECGGPEEEQCHVCKGNAKLLHGKCVQKCPNGYVDR